MVLYIFGRMKDVLIIALGGGIGSVMRYLGAQFISKNYPSHIPMGTLLINITGCLLIGLLIGLSDRQQWLNNEWKLLLITGFCGGYTTFSTFAAENINLIQNQQIGYAILYTVLSVALGLLAVWAGLSLGIVFLSN